MAGAVKLLLVLLSVLAAGVSAAVDGEGDQYMVEMELWIDGEQRGTPMVVLPPGEPGSIEVGDESGDGGWRIELLVEPPARAEGAPAGAIWLNLSVFEQREGEWEPLADSLLGVPEGRSATMSVVEAGVEQATPENSQVHLTASASLLRPGDARAE